jgi:hypothetical protein
MLGACVWDGWRRGSASNRSAELHQQEQAPHHLGDTSVYHHDRGLSTSCGVGWSHMTLQVAGWRVSLAAG